MRLFDMLTRGDIKRIKEPEKQQRIDYLQSQCRKAGRAIIELNDKYDACLKQVEELKAELARAKEDHQYDNLVHKNELKSLGKK